MAVAFSVARRYARALADILFAAGLSAPKQRSEVQKVKQQLTDFAALLRQHAPLRNVLASPAVSREKKLALLDQLRRRLGLLPVTRNFLAVLFDHRRLELLGAVLGAFDQEVYARLGIVPVEITTAFSLKEKQRRQLEESLATLTGSQVEVGYRQSPDILAGVVARLGSTIYDGSLRSQLRRLERQLAAESS